ncbi:MAG: ribonuclease H-like domain-containing protein [Iamia sp.]
MTRRPAVYGLDIETDTSQDGLDPRVAPVVTVALSLSTHDETFSGRESTLLFDLDQRLRSLPRGVLATWNGSAFDLPFLAYRAALHRLDLGLRLLLDPGLRSSRAPLPGHQGAYRGAWHHHSHLDAYRLYKSDVGPVLRVSCSLKSIARLVGLTPVEVDRNRIHDLSHEALHAYASSDARLARVLTERRMPGAARFIDHLAEDGGASATA